MMNKKMKNGFLGAVFGVSFVLFASSAYFIATEDYDIFFHSKKEKVAACRNSRLNMINDNYREGFYEQQRLEFEMFFEEKEKKLDSMRAAHNQMEQALFAKSDSSYRLSAWYQTKIRILDDSIAVADDDAAIARLKQQQENYLKKSDRCKKNGRQYYGDGVDLIIKNDSIRDSFFNSYQPPVFKVAEDLTKLPSRCRDSLIKDLVLRRLCYKNH